MIFLILSILSSTTNHLLFKAFGKYKIDLLTAIVINYATCSLIGYTSSYSLLSESSLFNQEWFYFSILQGAFLFICFYLIGKTTTSHGVAVTSLSTRLSVAIPTIAAFFLYGDSTTIIKIAGILTALFALSLSSSEINNDKDNKHSGYVLPALLFTAFGFHSTLLKYVQAYHLGDSSYHVYVMASFLSAFLISGSILLWRLAKKVQKVQRKDILAGVILGCTNYAALYFLISVLGIPEWESSVLFPTISISVVGMSSIGASLFFHERISRKMLIVLAIGSLSIILLNL